MPFERGRVKTGGRMVGVPNKATIEIKSFARSILEDPTYQIKLRQRIENGEAPHIEALLYYYVYGKPQQQEDATPLKVIVYGPREDQPATPATQDTGTGAPGALIGA